MTECEYCDEDFSSEKEKLEHELEEHGSDMTGHEKDEKKSELNKLQQQEQTSKHRKRKKLQYSAVGIVVLGLVAAGGFYAYQSFSSAGAPQSNASIGVGTPVHWHADYRITVCGESKILQGGPREAHTHGERTFHLEGVRESREQAELEWIVDQLGGQLENNSIMGRTNCNGEPANLTVKANGKTLDDPLNYVVRDGDFIRIRFR